MKITAEELFQDVINNTSSVESRLPVTGYTFSPHSSVSIIHTRYGDFYPEDMAEIVNYYLDKFSKKPSEEGEITVTTNEAGECVLVSRQDEDHKILKVIWEKK